MACGRLRELVPLDKFGLFNLLCRNRDGSHVIMFIID